MHSKPSRICFFPVLVEGLESRRLLTGLTIVPTFAANIRNDSRAKNIEAAIRAAIAQIDADFSNPITVPVLFQEGGGLGSNLTGFDDITYEQWRGALMAHAADANQRLAIANLPATNTLNGSDTVEINYANELALGIPDTFPASFATVTINVNDSNITRTAINPNKYDLEDLTTHELDEVLGIGSILDNATRNGQRVPRDAINPEDFFRYSAGPNAAPDFTTDANASVYFSIDGGKTDLAQFNQDVSGDFNDWYSINGGVVPQVQDAFGTPGTIPNYNLEPVVLDVLGYTPTRILGTGIVTGDVFNDTNGDGNRDANEANLPGWTVEAVQNATVVASVQSDALGYQLGSLPDGTYTIEVLPQAGYTQTSPVSSHTVTITGSNDTAQNQNFAEMAAPAAPPGAISGNVFNDVTGNGIIDSSVAPLANVKVTLHADTNKNGRLDGKDKSVAIAKTDSTGAYSFTNLSAGQYFITETVPPHNLRTDPARSNTQLITVFSGQQVTDQNFENYRKPATLGVKKISYTIGTKVVGNLRHRTRAGETITATFTVTNPLGETLSLVSYTAPSAVITNTTADQLQVFDTASNFYAPGTYTLTMALPASGHYQVDFVLGDPITQFGPLHSNIFYTSQGRLISQDNE
jgi:hypothetical protein